MQRRYLCPFKAHRLAHVLTDVLVIGGGVAGLRSALAVTETSPQAEVLLVTKQRLSESNTFWAQGGIASVTASQDSFESHIADTIKTACGLGQKAAIETVVREAPARIEELIGWGANFDRETDGRLALGREGGHSYNRIIHALGDATGRELANCLAAVTRAREQVSILEHAFILDLITLDGRCIGAVAQAKDRGLFLIFARQTLLASGGAGALYRETTNPSIATADGHAMAWRAGAMLRDMEMVQFHPTTIYIAGATRALVSEAVRGEGATLIDKNGYRFMRDYDPAGELASRDIVARAILAQLAKTHSTHVFLDARHLGTQAFQTRFPWIFETCRSFGIDPGTQPIPVHPSAHYMVGGGWRPTLSAAAAFPAFTPSARPRIPVCTGPIAWPAIRSSKLWFSVNVPATMRPGGWRTKCGHWKFPASTRKFPPASAPNLIPRIFFPVCGH